MLALGLAWGLPGTFAAFTARAANSTNSLANKVVAPPSGFVAYVSCDNIAHCNTGSDKMEVTATWTAASGVTNYQPQDLPSTSSSAACAANTLPSSYTNVNASTTSLTTKYIFSTSIGNPGTYQCFSAFSNLVSSGVTWTSFNGHANPTSLVAYGFQVSSWSWVNDADTPGPIDAGDMLLVHYSEDLNPPTLTGANGFCVPQGAGKPEIGGTTSCSGGAGAPFGVINSGITGPAGGITWYPATFAYSASPNKEPTTLTVTLGAPTTPYGNATYTTNGTLSPTPLTSAVGDNLCTNASCQPAAQPVSP
jgi:hypothetical protein